MSYTGVARVRHGEEETEPVVAVSPEKGKLLQNERKKAIAVRQGSPENGDNKTALLSGAYKSAKFQYHEVKINIFSFSD